MSIRHNELYFYIPLHRYSSTVCHRASLVGFLFEIRVSFDVAIVRVCIRRMLGEVLETLPVHHVARHLQIFDTMMSHTRVFADGMFTRIADMTSVVTNFRFESVAIC